MFPVIEIRKLVKQFPNVRAVDGVSFAVGEGVCFGLLGPNGAGKTTTIEVLEGLSPPTSGEVLYRGQPLGRRFRAEAGMQFQSTALQDYLTVTEHLRLFASLYETAVPLEDLIELCALGALRDRDAKKLSGGQRQRLLLAIALVNDPHVLFLDEPTTGMDPQARRTFWELVDGIKARGKTILVTTHYMEEAYVLCDEIAIMDHGRIIARGSPETLLAEHFRDVVLELPAEDYHLVPGQIPLTVLETRGSVEILAEDVDAAVQLLLREGVPLRRLQIRPRTLEDLFLELTGRELRA